MVEDAAVREAKEHQRRVAIEDARERMQSAPVRRGLPRPSLVSPLLSRDALTSDGPEGEVVAEMVRLVAQDATMFPVKGSKVSRRKSKALAGVEIDGAPPQCFSEEELVNARLMIDEEVADAETVMADLPTFSRVWEQCYQDWAYTPVTGKYIRLSEAKKSERLLALRHQYEIVRSQLDILEARARKVQDRLSMTLGGYMSRSKALSSQVSSATALVHNSGIELSCYSQLHALEQVAAVRRMDEALGAYMVEQEEEDRLQGEYGDLIDKRETLL
jgi:pre-mRNA-splicing factor CDC5/CEF1